jgi:hypothetical protein
LQFFCYFCCIFATFLLHFCNFYNFPQFLLTFRVLQRQNHIKKTLQKPSQTHLPPPIQKRLWSRFHSPFNKILQTSNRKNPINFQSKSLPFYHPIRQKCRRMEPKPNSLSFHSKNPKF